MGAILRNARPRFKGAVHTASLPLESRRIRRGAMRARQWMWIGSFLLCGCGSKQEAAPTVVVPTAVASSAAAAASPPAPTASAAPLATAAPSEPRLTEEEKFWSELANVFNREIKECASGWTGDGEITIKNDRIVRFTIDEGAGPGRLIPGLTGKKTPPVPAQLKKRLERPVSVSVCVGGPKIAHD